MLDILRDLSTLKNEGKILDCRVEIDSKGNLDIYYRPITPVKYIRLDFKADMHGITFSEAI